jgi:hypothetical protein
VQWNDAHVRLLNPVTGQLLREHPRLERGRHRIHDEDRPPRTESGAGRKWTIERGLALWCPSR